MVDAFLHLLKCYFISFQYFTKKNSKLIWKLVFFCILLNLGIFYISVSF